MSMAEDNNTHNHNHNNHNNRRKRAVDQPLPAKRQRTRKQLFIEYGKFIAIINELSREYDPSLLTCIKYTRHNGLKCDT